MKLKNILKNTDVLHFLMGLLIIFLLIFSEEIIASKSSSETLLLLKGTTDVEAAINFVIGLFLIICCPVKNKSSLRKVLSGKLVLMFCSLALAIFNTFNVGIIVDVCPAQSFWIVLIVYLLFYIYGLVRKKNLNNCYLLYLING